MAAHGKDRTRTKPNDAKNRLRRGRPKVCSLCAQQMRWVDYKDTNLLRRFVTDRGKIKARANTPGSHRIRVEVQCKTLGTKLTSEDTTLFYAEDGSVGSGAPQTLPQ